MPGRYRSFGIPLIMQAMRVRYVATATVLILAAVLAACGSGSGEQTEPVESVATAATATAATEPVVVAAPEGPGPYRRSPWNWTTGAPS